MKTPTQRRSATRTGEALSMALSDLEPGASPNPTGPPMAPVGAPLDETRAGPAARPGGAPAARPDETRAPQASAQPVGDDGQPEAALESDTQPFVTFYVDKELFAFPMTTVREIIRMPEVVRVPLSAPTLEGVANLRGQMLPVVNLRRTFHFAPQPYSAATRVIVVEDGALVGFIVDRVAMVINAQRDQIDPVSVIQVAVDAELLAGLIKGVAGHAMVMLLDVPRLLRTQARAGGDRPDRDDAPGSNGGPRGEAQVSPSERHLVSFTVSDQEYAFPIEQVQEIVQVPEHLSQVPNAGAHVLGVMTLRNRLLPLVSLRQMFHLPAAPLSSEHRIVVIELGRGASGEGEGGGIVGIVMDAVNEVLRVPERLIDPLPPFLNRREEGSEIAAICRLRDGKRLVSILSVERLFQHAALREALRESGGAQKMTTTTPRVSEHEEEEQLVVFRLDGQEYGVDIESVQEIIRLPENVTRVPTSAPSLLGVVNVRGQVLPVADLRAQFGLPSMNRDERQRIMVLSLRGAHNGFVVDSVSEVLKVPHSAIDVVPERERGERGGRLIGRIANLQKQRRMILLLDTTSLAAEMAPVAPVAPMTLGAAA